MEKMINNLEIKNFKSIKNIKMDCKRINVFIGEPNVGKTNILEALSLFVASTCDSSKPILKDYIRYEKFNNLFYDNDRNNIISVKTNIGVAYIRFHLDPRNCYDITVGLDNGVTEFFNTSKDKSLHAMESAFENYRNSNKGLESSSDALVAPFYFHFRDNETFDIALRGIDIDLTYSTIIKRYIFKTLLGHDSNYTLFLRPPFGDNLFSILESNPEMYDEVSNFFIKFGLDLLIDTEKNKLDIQKRVGKRVYKIPYSLTADTLQRIIFHIAAIETNNNSILLLEEPEAHSFPPYISLLAEKIIESKNNQFFVTTHSPYLLTPFIERCSYKDIAIFVCSYKDYETKVKALSENEIKSIMDTGIDFFFNIPAFTNK